MSTKAQANLLISKHLRKIALEETETLLIEGEDKMISKAEALARLIWKMALGSTEEKVTNKGVETIVRLPDKGMMNALFDRIEGKAVPVSDAGSKREKIADKISDQGKNRISEAGGISD